MTVQTLTNAVYYKRASKKDTVIVVFDVSLM